MGREECARLPVNHPNNRTTRPTPWTYRLLSTPQRCMAFGRTGMRDKRPIMVEDLVGLAVSTREGHARSVGPEKFMELLVEPWGIEPQTSSLRTRRSTI